MCFNERDCRHYFSEPAPAMRAPIERLKYVNDGIVVIIFFKASRLKGVRHEGSRADLWLKRHSLPHFSLDQKRGLTHAKAAMHGNESLLGTLGGGIRVMSRDKQQRNEGDDFSSAKEQSPLEYLTQFRSGFT